MVGMRGQTCDEAKTGQEKRGDALMGLDLRRWESCRERWREWRGRLYNPAPPLTLWSLLGYRIRGGIKRAARASPIPSASTRSTSWRGVIGVHVRIVATCTGRSGVIVLRTFSFLLSNTMHTRARVH